MEGLRDPELGRDVRVAQVASVIPGHRQNLRGFRRSENLESLEGKAGLCFGPFAKQVSRKLSDLVSFEQTVGDRIPLLKPEEPGWLGTTEGAGGRQQGQSGVG